MEYVLVLSEYKQNNFSFKTDNFSSQYSQDTSGHAKIHPEFKRFVCEEETLKIQNPRKMTLAICKILSLTPILK